MRKIILPGLGADSSMYDGAIYTTITGVIYANWPQYKGEKLVEEVADRIIKEYKITSADIVGGSSLGGIIAIEIAKKVKNSKVLLIGSTTLPSGINPKLKSFRDFTKITPLDLFKSLAMMFNPDNKVLEMLDRSNADFVKEMCRALFLWKGLENYNGTIYKIHGEKDRLFYPDKDAKIIPNGGHLIAMTHGNDVSEFIKGNIGNL